MSTLEIVITIVVTCAGVVAGIIYGFLPWRVEQMDKQQQTWQKTLGTLVLCIFVLLLVARYDLASWLILLGTLLGIAIAKIPAIHTWGTTRWFVFHPADVKAKQLKKQEREMRKSSASKRA